MMHNSASEAMIDIVQQIVEDFNEKEVASHNGGGDFNLRFRPCYREEGKLKFRVEGAPNLKFGSPPADFKPLQNRQRDTPCLSDFFLGNCGKKHIKSNPRFLPFERHCHF